VAPIFLTAMTSTKDFVQSLRPAEVCKALLAALEAAEGRRRKRKRDQTPDAIGLSIKRMLLAQAVEDDPNPEAFEEWLLDYPWKCATLEPSGAVSAMARAVLEEWRLAHSLGAFRVWLEQGAPSDDAKDEKPRQRSSS
jgi:hypothetical protein